MIRREINTMRSILRRFAPMLLAAAIAVPVLCNGCTAGVRVYDPYYHDYHGWAAETPYYNQWEHDTHRDHRDFDKRSDADKKEYWDWRHGQH
jgi:hypothetical protein